MPGNERLETRGSSTRLHRQSHSLGSSPSAWPREGGRQRGRNQRCHPRTALSSPSPGPHQPPPPLPEANKSLQARAAAPKPHLGGPSCRANPGPQPLTSGRGAAHPPRSAAPTAAEINKLACERKRSRREIFFLKKGSKQPPPSPWGKGEPLFKKVSHFSADKPAPRPAPVSAGQAPGSASSVPALRRFGRSSCGVSFHPLEFVPDGRAATQAPVTDSSSQNGGGGEGEGTRTRERAARPRRASGTELGAGGGGATARTLSHTRAPTPPPFAPRPRGRATAEGNGATCWRRSATARAAAAPAPHARRAGPATLAPTASAHPRPGKAPARAARRRPQGARGFSSPTQAYPQEKGEAAAMGADLVALGRD